jgi:hypothetical protein
MFYTNFCRGRGLRPYIAAHDDDDDDGDNVSKSIDDTKAEEVDCSTRPGQGARRRVLTGGWGSGVDAPGPTTAAAHVATTVCSHCARLLLRRRGADDVH